MEKHFSFLDFSLFDLLIMNKKRILHTQTRREPAARVPNPRKKLQ